MEMADDEPNSGLSLVLLPVVILDKIYEHLDAKTYLSLRRTSKNTKVWVESYSNRKGNLVMLKAFETIQVVIKGSGQTDLEELANAKVKNVSNFYINNDYEEEIWKLDGFSKFQTIYSAQIRKLRVEYFNGCHSETEWNFYESLNSLEDLEISSAYICIESIISPKNPAFLNNLKTLKVHCANIEAENHVAEAPHHLWLINPLPHCRKLEIWKFPYLFMEATTGGECWAYPPIEYPESLILSLNDYYQASVLQYIDMDSFDHDDISWNQIHEYVQLFGSKDIKLMNVHIPPNKNLPSDPVIFDGSSIVSVVVSSAQQLIRYDLPNLESIHVGGCNQTYQMESDFTLRKAWSKLKSLRFDLIFPYGYVCNPCESDGELIELIEFLINSEPRPEVRTLKIKFGERFETTGGTWKTRVCPDVFQVHSIVANLPNLTHLTLERWDSDDLSFAHLWRGLPLLQILKIRNCSTASDTAFIGENPAEPAFLKLTNLRKLTLELKEMDKVTDELFLQVLRHMKLKEFFMHPGKNVNLKAVEYLLDGLFARTVERFWCDTTFIWKPHEVEVKKLLQKFRSIP